MDDPRLVLVESWDEAQEFIAWLGEKHEILAVDTETEGFDWWRQRIRLCQIGDTDTGWAFEWDRWSGLLIEMLNRYDGQIVMHNFKFDMKFLKSHGVDIPASRIEDTRALAHLVRPDLPTGLKPLSDRLLGAHWSAGQEKLHTLMSKNKWTWATVPVDLPEYWAYGALDAVLTARLFQHLTPLAAPFSAVYDVEMASQDLLMSMEIKGARVDLEYCEQKAASIREWADSARAWARREYDVNIGSGPQVAAAMMKDGWRPTQMTATGKPSTAKDVLDKVDHPLAKQKIEVAHLEKMASGYFDNFIEMADGDRLHCNVQPLGARTGRMSIKAPALQTLPRTPLVRDAFVPSEGNRLLMIDYDQMEARLAAHYSKDENYIRTINEADDVHTDTAAAIYGVFPGEVTKEMRQKTKNVVYAVIYGAGVETLAKTAGISVGEARTAKADFYAAFPGVKDLGQKLSDTPPGSDGFARIRTRLGRLQIAESDFRYKLTNYLIQGTGADVLKEKIVELGNAGLDEYMVLPVHDEIVFDVPADLIDDVQIEAEQIMTAEDFNPVLTVDGKQADRWGDPYRV